MPVLEQGLISNGSKIAYSVGSPMNWLRIGEVLTVSDLDFTRDKVDRTVHSTNIYKRSLPGMASVADITVEVLGQPDETGTEGGRQAALRQLWKDGTTVYWRVEMPTDREQSAYKGFELMGFLFHHKLSIGAPGARLTFTIGIAYDDDNVVATPAGASQIA